MRYLNRSVVAVAVVVALAIPMQAREWNEQPGLGWVFRAKDRIVRVIKRTMVSLGDGLSDPKP